MELIRRPLSRLIDLPVEDEGGHRLGRVWDIRASDASGGDPQLTSLLIGRRALWERLTGGATGAVEVAWSDVVSVTDDRVLVRFRDS